MKHPSNESVELGSTGPGSWIAERKNAKSKFVRNPNLNVVEYSPRLDYILERINVAENAHSRGV